MKSILDPSFRYTSSANTDIRKTFARARREMRKQDVEQQPSVAAHPIVVTSLFRNAFRGPK